jgi:hypothetical protein
MFENSVKRGGRGDLIKGKGKRKKGKGKSEKGRGKREEAKLLLRNAGDDAKHVMQLDLITGFEVFRNRFGSDSGEAHLAL